MMISLQAKFLFQFCSSSLSNHTRKKQKKGFNQLAIPANPLILLVPTARIERATPGLGILVSSKYQKVPINNYSFFLIVILDIPA